MTESYPGRDPNNSTEIYDLTVAHLLGPENSIVALHVKLQFNPKEPYAVTFRFLPGGDSDAVPWTFGRDLLADGLCGQAGVGGVLVGPLDGDNRKTKITLLPTKEEDPNGTPAIVLFERSHLEGFLAETYKMVPKSQEDEVIRREIQDGLREFFS